MLRRAVLACLKGIMAKGKRKRSDRTGAACHFCTGSHTSSDCPTLDEDGEEGAGPSARKRGRKGRWPGGPWRSFAAARAFARSLHLTSQDGGKNSLKKSLML